MKTLSDKTKLVLVLGINCTLGYGTLLYSFSLLSIEIENAFEWTPEFIYGVYSLGIFLGGIAAPTIGKALDRYGAQYPMMFGSLMMAGCLYGLSTIDSKLGFVVCLLLLEIFSILVLYESAFVAIVQTCRNGKGAEGSQVAGNHSEVQHSDNVKEWTRLSITQITLMAGFASTIFWPLVSFLLTIMPWQQVYVLMSALHLMVCLPLYWWMFRTISVVNKGNQQNRIEEQAAFQPYSGLVSAEKRAERILALCFGCVAFCIHGLHVHLFSIMNALTMGHGVALMAGALIGPFQVVSRIMDLLSLRRVTPVILGIISIGFLLGGLWFLLLASLTAKSLLVFAAMFGMGQGLTYIVRGSIPLYLFGDHQYGRITGRLNRVRMIMTALAPVSFAVLMDKISASSLIVILMFIIAISLLALLFLRKQHAGKW